MTAALDDPESSQAGDIALYVCTEFPWRWEKHSVLISGIEAADTTLCQHDGLWWMFTVTRPGNGGYSDTLEIYHAESPLGPWQPHQKKSGADRWRAGAAGRCNRHAQWPPAAPGAGLQSIYGEALHIAA